METELSFQILIEQMEGREPPLVSNAPEEAEKLLPKPGIGFSQFNEVLLLLGYDRITESFFQFLIDGSSEYKSGVVFTGIGKIEAGVDRFRILAMWFYGNIRYALRRMNNSESTDFNELIDWLRPLNEGDFESRHSPVRNIERIEPKDTFYLGYVIDDEIRARLELNPNDSEAIEAQHNMTKIQEIGRRNHEAYLTWDHMDVYVATSMREDHQYYSIGKTTNEIFLDDKLQALKLRWFDPTQAYCKNRLDKGLAEALMLKRAFCTVYLVQEADSFGKDSELASTLAQGKVVIAYVPQFDSFRAFINEIKAMHRDLCPDREWRDLLMQQLQQYDPKIAWSDPAVRKWLDDLESVNVVELEKKLFAVATAVYDKRARILHEIHPLGLQVDLETGVGNGVLVARTCQQCVDLIYSTITQRLEFMIETSKDGTLLLKEQISGSVARVVTSDLLLTNSFWNFYPA